MDSSAMVRLLQVRGVGVVCRGFERRRQGRRAEDLETRRKEDPEKVLMAMRRRQQTFH